MRTRFWARFFRGRLWRHPDFVKMWTGQSLSELGSQVTLLALPTAAIKLLGAGPFQIGLLTAFEFLAFPVLGLVAGVWADRLKRRRILIACDAGRLLALGSVPAAYFAGLLSMNQLYAVALVTGVCTVFFDVAYQAYLPALVERTDLLEGNSKLEVTRSAAQVAGPALAGGLIQAIQAAPAIIVDAVSYLISVLTLAWIRKPEPEPHASLDDRPSFFGEMWEGIKVVLGHPVIRLISGSTSTSNLGSNMGFAILLVFAYNQLRMSPGEVGVIFGVGSVGALIGAFLAVPIARRLGLGPAIAASMGISGTATFLIPVASLGFAFPLLAGSFFVSQLGGTVYNINQVSLRQGVIPVRLQGRLNATVRTIVWGTIPLGAFAGGILGTRLGLVPTLYLSAAIGTLAVFFVLAPPVIRLKDQPEPAG
jgi:MFS family permease